MTTLETVVFCAMGFVLVFDSAFSWWRYRKTRLVLPTATGVVLDRLATLWGLRRIVETDESLRMRIKRDVGM